MQIRLAGLVSGVVLLLFAPAAIAAAPFKAGIRVEGASKTLLTHRVVTLADAPIVKDGDPTHSCPGQSAIGALQAGTGGAWKGTWSEGLGYFVSEIRGEKPTGSSFFSLWVNHRLASTGICQTDLDARDEVLLFVDRCVFDPATQGCKNKSVTPLGIRAPASVRRGNRFTVTVVSYTNSGRAVPAVGASVYANHVLLGKHTNSRGQVRVRATHIGRVSFFAKQAGKAKSEVDRTRIRKE